MKRSRSDGLLLFAIGSVMFVALGSYLEPISPDSMADFASVYYGSKCLLQHSDPYREADLVGTFQAQQREYKAASASVRRVVRVCVNLPTILEFVVPFALMPWGPAHVLWMMLTGASLILSGYLMWGFAARDAPIVSGALIGLFLFGSEMLLEIGNAAGIEVSLCLIAVWCFMENRLVPAGIFCLALGVAAKPHVAGLVWLYFWLAGGVFRKRAGQTLAVVVIVSLPAAIWVWHTAPHWMGELSANLRSASMHGQVDDPGPSSVDPRQHGAIMISLQTVFSMYRDDPRFYNPLSYFVSGALLLVWVVTTIRVHFSRERAWLALATIAPLSMLPIYHRLHDTCLLLLVFPAFAAIWAAGGAASWIGLALTGAGTVLTGDFPVQQLAAYAARLQGTEMGIWAKTLAFVLERPVPLVLLSMSIFYLWAYARQTGTATAVNAEAGEGSASWVNGLGQE